VEVTVVARRSEEQRSTADAAVDAARASIEADDLAPRRGDVRLYMRARVDRAVAAGLIALSPWGLAEAREPAKTTRALRAEVRDLEWLLRIPQVQRLALAAIGAIDPLACAPVDAIGAIPHAQELALLVGGCPLPAAPMARVTPMLERLTHDGSLRADVPAWFVALESAFAFNTRVGATPTASQILEHLRDIVGETRLWKRMVGPDARTLAAADKTLRELAVSTKRGGGRPRVNRLHRAVKGSSPVTAWHAAREFAAVFGFHAPERKADARRRGKNS
jgi:hypothetical protein